MILRSYLRLAQQQLVGGQQISQQRRDFSLPISIQKELIITWIECKIMLTTEIIILSYIAKGPFKASTDEQQTFMGVEKVVFIIGISVCHQQLET